MASWLIVTVRFVWDNIGARQILVLVQLFEFQILELIGGNLVFLKSQLAGDLEIWDQ